MYSWLGDVSAQWLGTCGPGYTISGEIRKNADMVVEGERTQMSDGVTRRQPAFHSHWWRYRIESRVSVSFQDGHTKPVTPLGRGERKNKSSQSTVVTFVTCGHSVGTRKGTQANTENLNWVNRVGSIEREAKQTQEREEAETDEVERVRTAGLGRRNREDGQRGSDSTLVTA